jgi:hypothetical protein
MGHTANLVPDPGGHIASPCRPWEARGNQVPDSGGRTANLLPGKEARR